MLVDTSYYDRLLRSGEERLAMNRSISDFVATLFYDVLKRMWRSIPRSGLIPETNAERWYTDMLLFEVSKKISKQDLKPLTNMIYEKLAGKVYGVGETARPAEGDTGKDVRSNRRSQGDEHYNPGDR